MARLLRLSPPGRRVREAVRAWWLVHLQHRRRERASVPAPAPAAPVIPMGWSLWDATEVGWLDTYFVITFDHGTLPVATFEVWERDSNNSLHLVNVIPSAARVDPYHDAVVAEDPDDFYYKVRYRNGEVIGPFSNEVQIRPEQRGA